MHSSVEVDEDFVTVNWGDGASTPLPHLWLRDNCWCDECRVVQTTEKAFRVATVPIDLAPTAAHVTDDRLELVWPDGHRTVYTEALIKALTCAAPLNRVFWGEGFMPQSTDWSAFLTDDHAAIVMIKDFLATGAALLTDAPTEPGALEDLAPRLGPIHEVLFERIHNVRLDPAGYNVAHTAMELPPHNDMASYSWPPSIQGLHFLSNETPGGESVIVDGWAVLNELRSDYPELFDSLCTMPVPFRQFDDDNETFATEPIVRLDADGNIVAFRYSNQLMQPMNPLRPGIVEFYRAYHELSTRLLAPETQAVFRVEGGQVLLVASHRVLHARKAFQPIGSRHLQDAYFEHDNLRNHLTVLRRRVAQRESTRRA